MFAWSWFAIYEPAAERHAPGEPVLPKSAFPWAGARVVALVTIGIAILYYIQAVQLGRMFGDHGATTPAQISVYVSIASLGVILGGWTYSHLGNLPIRARFALIFLALGIGYTGIGLAPTLPITLAFALVAQFANGLTIPTLVGWALGKFDFETSRARHGRLRLELFLRYVPEPTARDAGAELPELLPADRGRVRSRVPGARRGDVFRRAARSLAGSDAVGALTGTCRVDRRSFLGRLALAATISLDPTGFARR
jgi:hypothetical protein